MSRLVLLRALCAAWIEAFKRSERRWKVEQSKLICTPQEAMEAVLQHEYTPMLRGGG